MELDNTPLPFVSKMISKNKFAIVTLPQAQEEQILYIEDKQANGTSATAVATTEETLFRATMRLHTCILQQEQQLDEMQKMNKNAL